MKIRSIKTRFLIGTAAAVLALGLTMILPVNAFLRTKLDNKLEKRGMTIARSIARDSVDPLLTDRHVDLDLMIRDYRRTEEDIAYIFIVDGRGEIAAHTFEGGFPTELKGLRTNDIDGKVIARRFASGQGMIKDIAIPLMGGTLGAAHVGLFMAVVDRDIDDIAGVIIGIIMGLIIIGGALAFMIAASVTKPIHLLVVAAQGIEKGNLGTRVPLRTDDEIGLLAGAFNRMAEARMHNEAEREKLISKLREALDKIKTLKGMMPICASCKKIRDDKGYWTQIELYISEHSDAEFSHGICPDCAKKLYPEYYKDAT